MRRTSLLAGLAIAGLLAFAAVRLVVRESSPSGGGGTAAGAPTPVPGVVLICLDTLRADALSLDSGRPVRMPRLEAFAREGVAFVDAVAPAAWTGPSITSLLTGLDPSHSGVVGLPERIGNVSPAVKTLSERLAAAGWHTGAVTTGAWLMPGTSALRGTQSAFRELDRDPEGVIARWAASRPAHGSFFAFLHALAAHDPYLEKARDDNVTPPTPAAIAAVDEARARAIVRGLDAGTEPSDEDMRWIADVILRSGANRARLRALIGLGPLDALFGVLQRWLDGGSERDAGLASLAATLRDAYVESLAHVDALFGRILDGLEAQHLPLGTVVIVVADHGESFAEHGTLLHGRRLYDELLRVPFLVKASGRLGAPRLARGAVGLVDVVPTVLELAGLPPAAGLDGIGLVGATASPASLPDRALRAYDERRRFVEGVEHVELLESVRTPRVKAIIRRDAASRRILAADVFDLGADPLERHPIPFNAFDRPCGFGDAFARALRDSGLSVPCLDR